MSRRNSKATSVRSVTSSEIRSCPFPEALWQDVSFRPWESFCRQRPTGGRKPERWWCRRARCSERMHFFREVICFFRGCGRLGSNDDGVYRAMCRAEKAGKIRSIGISNFYTEKSVSHFINEFDIAPSVIQNENHLKYQNNSLRDWAAKRGIFIKSYYPFGGLNRRLQYRLLNLNIIFKSGSLYKKYVFISPLPFTSMSMEFP